MGRAAVERAAVKFGACLASFLISLLAITAASAADAQKPTVIVVAGAAGEEEFGKIFRESAEQWAKAGQIAGANVVEIGMSSAAATNDLEQFRAALTNETKTGLAELRVVFLGHGTFDGKEAKFNLRGPDLSAVALSNLLIGFQRPVAVVNAASSSAPFIKSLTGTNRI